MFFALINLGTLPLGILFYLGGYNPFITKILILSGSFLWALDSAVILFMLCQTHKTPLIHLPLNS